MPYLVETTNLAAPRLRERLRPAHLAYLDARLDLILAAGAKLAEDGAPGPGSFYILDVEKLAEAQAFMADEPYHSGGLLSDVRYNRWRCGYFDHRRLLPADAAASTSEEAM